MPRLLVLFWKPPHRPNGSGDPSPGLRPQADALGTRAPHHGGLKGRESLAATSRRARTTGFATVTLKRELTKCLAPFQTGLKFPVVPRGDESIRFQISADHTPCDIDSVLQEEVGLKTKPEMALGRFYHL
jgi:hypothetical protein